MRKISGIIPPNARTQSAEISRSQPARPGAPDFGRPMGKNSQADRISLSRELEELRASGEMPQRSQTYTNTTEGRRAKLVQDLSDRFFSAKGEGAGVPKSEGASESVSVARSLYTVEPELMNTSSERSDLKEPTK